MTTEEFLDGLKGYVSSNYAAFLVNQPGGLPDFKEVEIGGRDPFNCLHYPSLSMHLSNEDEEWQSITDIQSELKVDMAISVMNPKADTAHRYQLRYTEAFKEMIKDDQTIGNIVMISGIQGIRHYPPGSGGQGSVAVTVFTLNVKL